MNVRATSGMNVRRALFTGAVLLAFSVVLLGFAPADAGAARTDHSVADHATPNPFEPNDDFGSATNASDGYYADLRIGEDDVDFYAVEMAEGEELNASIYFSHDTGDLDMRVYAPTQEQVAEVTTTTDDERVTVTAQSSGTYYVEVFGSQGATAPYDLEIRTSSGLADAVCSLSDTEVPPGTTVFLNAGASRNAGLYEYDKEGDGVFEAEDEFSSRSFTYNETGTYNPRVAALNASDDSRDVAACGELTVDENQEPNANLTYSPTAPAPGETVTFDGTHSTDPDGDDLIFFGYDVGNDGSLEGVFETRQPFEWTFEEPGTYEVRLEAHDEHGAIGNDTVTVDVGTPATLTCSVGPSTVVTGEDVTVDATESEGIETMDVDIDGDETFERENVDLAYTYQYEEPGQYTVLARSETAAGTEFATCGDVSVEQADPTLPDDMTVTVTDPWTEFTGEETTVTFETVITADGEPYEYGEYGSPDASHFEVTIGGASVPTEDLTVTEQSQDRYTVEAVVPVESIRGYDLDVAFTDEKAGSEATVQGSANVLVPVLEAMDGTGTPTAPYVVTNATELQAIDADRDAHVRLGNDIDASETETWFGGSGFIPIGTEGERFNATFEGDGNTIAGLTIDREGRSFVGLFHTIGASGVVTNVTLDGVDIVGEGTTGGLAGMSLGTVRRASATGTVVGGSETGGLVGEIRERSNDDSVFRSYADVNVTGGYATGGLVGYNGGGRIAESFATGDVDGGEIVGGLVGYNYDGVIAKSYAQGDVHGDRRVAGLVGENQHAASSPGGGLVNETYATGRVTATEELTGGLVATETIAEIENSYWDAEATGQERALGMRSGDDLYAAGKLRTVEMQGEAAESNMSNFDFDRTWRTVEDGYPVLQWAAGTPDDPVAGDPVVSCSVDPASSSVGETVTVDASGSTGVSFVRVDVDGDGEYEYTDETDLVVTHTYNRTGTFEVAAIAGDTGERVACGAVEVSTGGGGFGPLPDPVENPVPYAGGALGLLGLGGLAQYVRSRGGGKKKRTPRKPPSMPEDAGAANYATGTFETPAETGTTTVTGVGFEPDLLLFSAAPNVRALADGGMPDRTTGWTYGRAVRTGEDAIAQTAMTVADDAENFDTAMGVSSDGHALELVHHYDDPPGRLLGTVTGTTADGFEMRFDASELRGDRAGDSFVVLYQAFSLGEKAEVEVGHFRTPDAAGAQAIDLGVDANHVMLLAANGVDDVNGRSMTDLPVGFSVADVVGRTDPGQVVRSVTSDPGARTAVSRAVHVDRAIHLLFGDGGRVNGHTTARVTSLGERMTLEYEKRYSGPSKLGSSDSSLVTYVAVDAGRYRPEIGYFRLPEPGSEEVLSVDVGFKPGLVTFTTVGLDDVDGEATDVTTPLSFDWAEGTVESRGDDLVQHALDGSVDARGRPGDPVAASVRIVAESGHVVGRDDLTVTAFTENGFEIAVTSIGTDRRDADAPRPYVVYKAWPDSDVM